MKKAYQDKSPISIVLLLMALVFAVSPMIQTGAGVSGGNAPFPQNTVLSQSPLHEHSYAEVKLSKGKFLVASRGMADPRFKETVIFLVTYDKGGAMGLVINRPSEVKLRTLFPELKGIEERNDTVFLGGPVARNQIVMLIRTTRQSEEAVQVFQDISVSSNMAMLKHLVAEGREMFRVYSGYSGWGAGQLEWELSRGDWHVMQASSEAIFKIDPSDVWHELIIRSSAIQVRDTKHQRCLS